MAYKINGTTVVDNSRNVCACCVTSCCVTASTRLDVPSGDTASRPASPSTGSLYFDTDEGALVAYDGTDWSSVGGAEVVAKFSSGDDGTVAATSYLLGKTNCLCMCCMGINSGCIPTYFSVRTPLCRASCTPASDRGGHISFGADGSFVMTTGAFKNIPAQQVTGSDDKCFRHMTVTHGVFQNNRCCYKISDAVAVTGYVACCYQPTSRAMWCLNKNICCQRTNICTNHTFFNFYSLFASAGNSENGGYLTGGCVPGCADYIVPYTSLGNSLCPAYKMVGYACTLIKSVVCNYVLTNYCSCGGRWVSGGLNNLLGCAQNNGQGLPWGNTITCQNCSADLFLQDVTDLGYYTKSGDCYTTIAAGTCGCFRHLNTRNGCGACYNGNIRQHAFENKCSGDIFVVTRGAFSLPCITWSNACSAYNCLIPKLLKINRSTGCMTLYRPFGCGCGGGNCTPNPECMNCHAVFGANTTRCSINSIFYTYPNSDCVRVITAHNTYDCQGTCRYFEHGFTLWNVSNAACIYAICSGQFRTCVENISCCHAIPMHINLLHWDEASCRGFWSMAFNQCYNKYCSWSNRGVGFAITETDFSNCALCMIQGVRACGSGLHWGQWGGGSLQNCCSCIKCCIMDSGDGIWPMKNGHIALKWNFEHPQGHCNCCSGAFVRLEDWTCSTFNICCILPSSKRCVACYVEAAMINCCAYTDTLCNMPKYCCICTAQYCLTDTCGTQIYYCLFPHSATADANHYCLCETTYGEAVCWVDRPSTTCCICGCVNFGGSSAF